MQTEKRNDEVKQWEDDRILSVSVYRAPLRKQPIFIQAIRKEYNTYTIKAGNTIIEKNITKTGAQLSIECLCDGYVNDGYTISDYTSLCFTASK